MNIYQWLCVLGIPSLVSGLITFFISKNRKMKADMLSLKLGVQALLRSEMIDNYNKWSERGYMPIYAKENFESCYTQYHNLGANGVMDSIYEKVMSLPERNPNE